MDEHGEHLWGDELTTADVIAALEAAGWRWEPIEPGCEPVLTWGPAHAYPSDRIDYAACGWCGDICVVHGHALVHLTLGNEVYCGGYCQRLMTAQMRREQRWLQEDA